MNHALILFNFVSIMTWDISRAFDMPLHAAAIRCFWRPFTTIISKNWTCSVLAGWILCVNVAHNSSLQSLDEKVIRTGCAQCTVHSVHFCCNDNEQPSFLPLRLCHLLLLPSLSFFMCCNQSGIILCPQKKHHVFSTLNRAVCGRVIVCRFELHHNPVNCASFESMRWSMCRQTRTFWKLRQLPTSSPGRGATCLAKGILSENTNPYILKTRVLAVQTPQTICNFPQKDCLKTRKLAVSLPES